jgi:hypothetical protein
MVYFEHVANNEALPNWRELCVVFDLLFLNGVYCCLLLVYIMDKILLESYDDRFWCYCLEISRPLLFRLKMLVH